MVFTWRCFAFLLDLSSATRNARFAGAGQRRCAGSLTRMERQLQGRRPFRAVASAQLPRQAGIEGRLGACGLTWEGRQLRPRRSLSLSLAAHDFVAQACHEGHLEVMRNGHKGHVARAGKHPRPFQGDTGWPAGRHLPSAGGRSWRAGARELPLRTNVGGHLKGALARVKGRRSSGAGRLSVALICM